MRSVHSTDGIGSVGLLKRTLKCSLSLRVSPPLNMCAIETYEILLILSYFFFYSFIRFFHKTYVLLVNYFMFFMSLFL